MAAYPKLTIEEFGAHLLSTGDLDPVYIALNECGFDNNTRNRWLTAYCAFYHSGFASYASDHDGADFWDIMMIAAKNEVPTPFGERWPRSSERRHFRGQQAIKAIEDWQTNNVRPEDMFQFIEKGAPSFLGTSNRAKTYRSVGNWLSFKIVDLVDACMDGNIDQTNVMLFMYDAPLQSLLNRWREHFKLDPKAMPKDLKQTIMGMVDYYKEAFKDYTVPHKPGQDVDMFCLETILCKYQSHLNGHYPLGKDTKEINHGLLPWCAHSTNAKKFFGAMPRHA